MSTLNTENQILFNSVALTDDDIAVAKLDKFYIKILFTEYGLGKKTDKVYLEINYEKDFIHLAIISVIYILESAFVSIIPARYASHMKIVDAVRFE